MFCGFARNEINQSTEIKEEKSNMDDFSSLNKDLDHIVRLSLSGQTEEVRLYVARLVRKYRHTRPHLSGKLESYLQAVPKQQRSLMRKGVINAPLRPCLPM
jgi:hypothetical protein